MPGGVGGIAGVEVKALLELGLELAQRKELLSLFKALAG
jgi:hypothetical protein